jgi:hypothetical protein
MQFERLQERGGRKGGLPISEDKWLLASTGLSAALGGDEKAMLEKSVAVTLKQCRAQTAMQAASSVVFCVWLLGKLWWRWSQSGIASDIDTSMVLLPAAKPTAAGSVATDRAIRTAKMARPIRIGSFVSLKTLSDESANSKANGAAE